MPEALTATEQVEAVESAVSAEAESQQVTEPEPKETPAAVEPTPRVKLEKTVREKLEALDADEDEPSAEEPGERPETSAEPEAAESAGEAAATEVTPVAPTLPAAHVRSLKAFGLSDAEIAKTSPEVAAALHARRNQEITRWAEAGRKTTPAPQATQPAAASPPAPAAPVAKIDIAALKQTYGDEPLIAVLEAQQKKLEAFEAYQQRYEADVQQRQLETLGRQVDQFFSGQEKVHQDLYGTDSKTLTPTQVAEREKVLQLADAIVTGARQSGVNIGSLEDALQTAFDSVSAPTQKTVARQEIVKQLQPRAKGITLKPGGRPNLSVNPKKELQKTVKSKLKEIFTD